MSKPTAEYNSWRSMIERCSNEKSRSWPWYGGRGIKVCERWQSFENFLADMGKRPDGMSLDRINNNGNYEPGNCKWSTQKEQCSNSSKRKSSSRFVGVYLRKPGKWRAELPPKYGRTYLGTFETEEAAGAAVEAAKRSKGF